MRQNSEIIIKRIAYLSAKNRSKTTRYSANPSRFCFSGKSLKSLRWCSVTLILPVALKLSSRKWVEKLLFFGHAPWCSSDVSSDCFPNRCSKVLTECSPTCIITASFKTPLPFSFFPLIFEIFAGSVEIINKTLKIFFFFGGFLKTC